MPLGEESFHCCRLPTAPSASNPDIDTPAQMLEYPHGSPSPPAALSPRSRGLSDEGTLYNAGCDSCQYRYQPRVEGPWSQREELVGCRLLGRNHGGVYPMSIGKVKLVRARSREV